MAIYTAEESSKIDIPAPKLSFQELYKYALQGIFAIAAVVVTSSPVSLFASLYAFHTTFEGKNWIDYALEAVFIIWGLVFGSWFYHRISKLDRAVAIYLLAVPLGAVCAITFNYVPAPFVSGAVMLGGLVSIFAAFMLMVKVFYSPNHTISKFFVWLIIIAGIGAGQYTFNHAYGEDLIKNSVTKSRESNALSVYKKSKLRFYTADGWQVSNFNPEGGRYMLTKDQVVLRVQLQKEQPWSPQCCNEYRSINSKNGIKIFYGISSGSSPGLSEKKFNHFGSVMDGTDIQVYMEESNDDLALKSKRWAPEQAAEFFDSFSEISPSEAELLIRNYYKD